MSNPLWRITEEEWRAKAHAAHYHAGELAERMAVSLRTLEVVIMPIRLANVSAAQAFAGKLIQCKEGTQ